MKTLILALLSVFSVMAAPAFNATPWEMQVFTNVSDMVLHGAPKGVNKASLTLGYTTPGDGNGAVYLATNNVTSTNITTRIYSGTTDWSWERVWTSATTVDTSGLVPWTAVEGIPYDPITWNSNTNLATKDVIRDEFEALTNAIANLVFPPGSTATNIAPNPTDGFDAVRSNATTFRDGHWFYRATNAVANQNYTLLGTTNALPTFGGYDQTLGIFGNGTKSAFNLDYVQTGTVFPVQWVFTVTNGATRPSIYLQSYAAGTYGTGNQLLYVENLTRTTNQTSDIDVPVAFPSTSAIAVYGLSSPNLGNNQMTMGVYGRTDGHAATNGWNVGVGAQVGNSYPGSTNAAVFARVRQTNGINMGFVADMRNSGTAQFYAQPAAYLADVPSAFSYPLFLGRNDNGTQVFKIGGNGTLLFGAGDTNALFRSGSDLIATNGDSQTLFKVVNGSGASMAIGLNSSIGRIVASSGSIYSDGLFGANTAGPRTAMDILGSLAVQGNEIALTADDTTITTSSTSTSVKWLNSDNNTPANRTVHFSSSGVRGQVMELIVTANAAQVLNGDTVGSGLVKLSSDWNGATYSALTLRSDGTNWIETARWSSGSGGGVAGTMINTGANVVGNVPYATDTTSTNYAPSGALSVGAGTNTTLLGQLWFGSATNNLSRSGTDLVLTNGGLSGVKFTIIDGTAATSSLVTESSGGPAQSYFISGVRAATLFAQSYVIPAGGSMGFSIGDTYTTAYSTRFKHEGLGIMGLNNGPTAQEYRIYTSTNSGTGDYQRMSIKDGTFDMQAGGASVYQSHNFKVGGTNLMVISASGPAVAITPAAANQVSVAVSGGSTTGSGTGKTVTIASTANTSGVIDGAVTIAITDTASGSGSEWFQVLGGASGTTELFKVDKSGYATVASTAGFVIGSRGYASATGDGVWVLNNNAGNGFTSLQLGPTDSAANNASILGVTPTGTDKDGGSLTGGGGQSTGTGRGGALIGKTSPSGSTGSSANAYSERYHFPAKAIAMTDTTPTTVATIACATGKFVGGTCVVTVFATEGTDFQARTLTFPFSAVNKSGTVTAGFGTPVESIAASTGTLAVTITTVANGSAVDIKVNPDTSFGSTTTFTATIAFPAINGNDTAAVTEI